MKSSWIRRIRGGALSLTVVGAAMWASGCGGESTEPAAVTTGSLSVTIAGLPSGATASVLVAGGAFSQTLTASTTLTDLAPGTYTVTANDVVNGLHRYGAAPSSQSILVPARATPAVVNVDYDLASGGLAVTVAGLPGGTSADVRIAGPGLADTIAASQTYNSLNPGSYDIAATAVVSGPDLYAPSPANQTIVVDPSLTPTPATVTYANAGPAPFNLTIDDAYLVQVVQRYGAGTSDVPVVAGRDAVLRVFVTASQGNSETPDVRVRLYQGGSLIDTRTLTAPGPSVPLAPNESVLSLSWNTTIAAGLLQPGLSVLVDVDPTNAVAESDENDNVFPAGGTPMTVDVRTLSQVAVRLVPVFHDSTGRTGNVTAGNLASYVTELADLFPTAGVDADLGATYTTTAPPLQSNNGNNAWGIILSEIRALRIADGSSRYYYGVVSPDYSSGVAGLGYVPGTPTSSSKASIGWDKTNSRAGVLAHELGHNHGRRHSPGCGAGNPDAGYPYASGSIGVYGLDVAAMQVKSPSTHFDFMTYCNSTWISDYVYEDVVQWRESEPLILPGATSASTTVMLVWGRITPRGMVLEPAFTLVSRPVLPEAPGPYRLVAEADDGSTAFSVSFAGEEVADLPGGPERHFAFAVPVDGRTLGRIRSLSLEGPAGRVEKTTSARAATPDTPAHTAERSGNALRIDWDARQHPMTMVRDRATGRVVALVRGGAARVVSPASDVELLFSDGVKSASRRLRLP